MNQTTDKTQNSISVEIAKEGLRISEQPLKKLLQQRAAIAKAIYAKEEITDASFNRAKAEEEMIKAVAGYNLSVEALLEAQTLENQQLRAKLTREAEKHNRVWLSEAAFLRLTGTEVILNLRLAQKGLSQ